MNNIDDQDSHVNPVHFVESGEEFEAAVTVRIDGRELRGCGRWLSNTTKSKEGQA